VSEICVRDLDLVPFQWGDKLPASEERNTRLNPEKKELKGLDCFEIHCICSSLENRNVKYLFGMDESDELVLGNTSRIGKRLPIRGCRPLTGTTKRIFHDSRENRSEAKRIIVEFVCSGSQIARFVINQQFSRGNNQLSS
jgi:hypothetical protein